MNTNGLLIIGMHRSGTSCLAGSLQQLGLHLGEVYKTSPYNKKGNRESADIMALNTELMQYNNGDWNSPTTITHWTEEHITRRDSIIDSLSTSSATIWGFKDPRTTFTLPFWLEAIPDCKLVASFRHPLAVAKSLESRNNFTISQGIKLWISYNRELLVIYEKNPFPITSFDNTPSGYYSDLLRISKELGLPCDVERTTDFFDTSLRHHGLTDKNHHFDLLDDANDIYQKIQNIHKKQTI